MMLAASLLTLAPAAPPQVSLSKPTRLLLEDGTPLDLSEGYGHTGPLVVDLDGTGRPDLIVGDLRGHLHGFTASGSAGAYVPQGPLSTGGKPIRVHNW